MGGIGKVGIFSKLCSELLLLKGHRPNWLSSSGRFAGAGNSFSSSALS